jgi:hypothetical protein
MISPTEPEANGQLSTRMTPEDAASLRALAELFRSRRTARTVAIIADEPGNDDEVRLRSWDRRATVFRFPSGERLR